MVRPTVAVITTNYNHARYLPESIGSVLAQTRQPDEYWIIDDASTDDSRAVIASLSAGYPWIRVLHNERNLGPIASVNRAIVHTSCDYILFLSADDRIAPQFIERSSALVAQHPTAAICSALTDRIDEDGRPLGLIRSPLVSLEESWLSPQDARDILLRYGSWIQGNAALFNREALATLGGLQDDLGPMADEVLHALLPLRYGACFIPEVLASFRRTESNYYRRMRHDPAEYPRIGQQAIALLRAHSDTVPREYVDRRERLLQLHVAYDAALAREADVSYVLSATPLGTILRRLRTDLVLIRLVWRYRAAWWADRQRVRRVARGWERAGRHLAGERP